MTTLPREDDVHRIVDALVQQVPELGGDGGSLLLAGQPLVTDRSILYPLGPASADPRYMVKVVIPGDRPPDGELPLSAAEQFTALDRAYRWFEDEDAHGVARPVALLEELDALAMAYVPGPSVARALQRARRDPAAAHRAAAAAGDFLRRMHRHARVPDADVDLADLVEELLAIETSVLRPAGLRLPPSVRRALDAVPRIRLTRPQVLLHGDFVGVNLVLTGPDEVTMLDPSLVTVGLPEEDAARFLNLLATDSAFIPGAVQSSVRRLRHDLDRTFRAAYDPETTEPSTTAVLLELRLLRQYALRWCRRRQLSRLAGHAALMWGRRAVIDLHMRSLVLESGRRLEELVSAVR